MKLEINYEAGMVRLYEDGRLVAIMSYGNRIDDEENAAKIVNSFLSNDELTSELVDARELIANLRTMLTEQAQKVEDLERKAYQDKLVRDGLVEQLTIAVEALDEKDSRHTLSDSSIDGMCAALASAWVAL